MYGHFLKTASAVRLILSRDPRSAEVSGFWFIFAERGREIFQAVGYNVNYGTFLLQLPVH